MSAGVKILLGVIALIALTAYQAARESDDLNGRKK